MIVGGDFNDDNLSRVTTGFINVSYSNGTGTVYRPTATSSTTGRPQQIDYIMYHPGNQLGRVLRTKVLPYRGSDHLPLEVDIAEARP